MRKQNNSININARYDVRHVASAMSWLEEQGIKLRFSSNIVQHVLASFFYSLPKEHQIRDIAQAWAMLDERGLLKPSQLNMATLARPINPPDRTMLDDVDVEQLIDETVRKVEGGENNGA